MPFFFEFAQPHSQGQLLVKCEDTTPEEAEKLINRSLYLPLQTLPELDGTDFYYHEIVGFQIIGGKHGVIGILENVNDSGAQALFEIKSDEKEILIPVVDEWILEVEREGKFIKIASPVCLIDLYLG